MKIKIFFSMILVSGLPVGSKQFFHYSIFVVLPY